MRGPLGRLRWQLTLSHLVATAFTLVCLIAAAGFFATFLARSHDSPAREPAQDAQTLARAIAGLAAGSDAALLDDVLAALVDGRLRGSAYWNRPPRLVCGSPTVERDFCPVDTSLGVQLGRTGSSAACVENQTWGWTAQGIWASGGCQAEFLLQR